MVCSNELMRTFFNDSYTSCDSHCTFFFQRTIHIVSFSDGAECTNRMNPNCVAFCGRDFWQRKNISSAPPSHTMNCDIILDESVKSGSLLTTILPTREYGTFKFPNGTLLRQDIVECPDTIRLLQSRNYKTTSAGFIAAMPPSPVKCYSSGFVTAKLVLLLDLLFVLRWLA